MFNISFAMGMFSYQNWSHSSVSTLIFDGFRLFFNHLSYFLVLKSIFDGKSIAQPVHHIPVFFCDEGIRCRSTMIYLFDFNDNFSRILLWSLSLNIILSYWRGCSTITKCNLHANEME